MGCTAVLAALRANLADREEQHATRRARCRQLTELPLTAQLEDPCAPEAKQTFTPQANNKTNKLRNLTQGLPRAHAIKHRKPCYLAVTLVKRQCPLRLSCLNVSPRNYLHQS